MTPRSDRAKYFLLNEKCIMINGAVNGAVYNLNNGEVFSIKRMAVQILEQCGKYKSLKTISATLKIPLSDLYIFLDELKKNNLGSFYRKPVYIDNPLEFYQLNVIPTPIILKNLTIEIHRMCNLNCTFCMGKNRPRNKYVYCGCSKENNSPILSLNTIRKVVNEARKFALKSIFIIGGSPFLLKKEMAKLLRFFYKNSISVTVHSHGTDLDDYQVELIKDLEVKLIIPVYSSRENTHDEIVGVKKNYRTLLAVLEKLKNKGVDFYLTNFLSEDNIGEHRETSDFFRKLGCTNISHRFVFPVNPAEASRKFLTAYNEMKMTFPKMNSNLFLLNKYYNHCLDKKIAITAEGNIVPCHLAKSDIVGHISNDNLGDILRQGKLEPYWKFSKERVEICALCEFRYACLDCPIIGKEVNHEKRNFKNSYCKYNPIIGEMEEA